MTHPNREWARQQEGKRVRLIYCADVYTRLQPGDCGTVQLVDDMGTWHIAWDKGHRLGLVAEGGDRWELL